MRNKNRSLGALMTTVQPWGEPVDGKSLLDEIERVMKGHVVLPKWGAETLALWCVHTYAFELRDVGTYIGIESPEKRCGKSTLLGVLRRLVNRPVMATNISSPAFFRVIEETQPTLLIDEADTFLAGNDELRGMLNAGYSRETAYVIRVSGVEGGGKKHMGNAECGVRSGGGLKKLNGSNGLNKEDQEMRNPPSPGFGASGAEEGTEQNEDEKSRLSSFSCWCPKAMAAIGRLPDTLADRCIVIRMQRKVAGEKCERPRKLETTELNRKCARFVMDNAEAIASAQPELPSSLHDRAGDIWEPLLVLADLAGGDWPERARQAAVRLTTGAQENCPIGALLFDLFVVFTARGVEKLFTREVLSGLSAFENRPWHSMRRGAEITEAWLAQRLRPYGIKPQTIRVGEDVGRGYLAEDFTESLKRYVPKPEREELLAELKGQVARRETKKEVEEIEAMPKPPGIAG